MIIKYTNGKSVEAFILSRSGNHIRAAVCGAEDVIDLRQVQGVWVSDDCEPVQIEFAWEAHAQQADISETDCICTHALAAKLIRRLLTDSTEDEPAADLMWQPAVAPAFSRLTN